MPAMTFDKILKYNHNHDELGRFATASSSTSIKLPASEVVSTEGKTISTAGKTETIKYTDAFFGDTIANADAETVAFIKDIQKAGQKGILYSREKEDILKLRDIYRQYQKGSADQDTFFESTIAEFTEIKNPPSRDPDYISRSKDGSVSSVYWYTDSGVIRGSGHWGAGVASCDWFLKGIDGEGLQFTEEIKYGECKWKDFIRKCAVYYDKDRETGGNYAFISSFKDSGAGSSYMGSTAALTVEESTMKKALSFRDIFKYNHNHGADGRFTTADGAGAGSMGKIRSSIKRQSDDILLDAWEKNKDDISIEGMAVNAIMETELEDRGLIRFNDDTFEYERVNAPKSQKQKSPAHPTNKDSGGKELTPEQAEYFKDSKARDDDGNLMILYHNTDVEGIETFRTQTPSGYGGLYMSDSKDVAQGFGGGQTYQLYANLENPLIVDAKGKAYDSIEPRPEWITDFPDWKTIDTNMIAAYARDNGYDGVIVKDVREPTGYGTDVIAFEPSQVKDVRNEKPTKDKRIAKTFTEILKFNPYHGYHGYFSTAEGATFTTNSTKYGPGQKAIDNIKRSKVSDMITILNERKAKMEADESNKINSSGYSKKVISMMGEAVTKEYDTGDHPNKYDPDDPRWGTEPGTYTVYRSGGLDRDIVFTASTMKGSELYADSFPESAGGIDPKRCAAYTYTVEIKKPFVSKDMPEAYEKLFGKKVNLDPSPAQIKKGITTGDLWVKADEKIAAKLKKMGYDAWTMTSPAPPAKKEMNILAGAKSTMKETGRKVPDHIKKIWAKEAEKDGFYTHAYKDGKEVMTIDEWFKTDDYKAGKEAGKWA